MFNYKAALAAGVALVFSSAASAQDWFQFEAGIGMQQSTDDGDGIWKQVGAFRNEEQLRSPIFLAGLTGDVWSHGAWSVRYHADYVYAGQISASCLCVPDENYSVQRHMVMTPTTHLIEFNGFGHTQGVALTSEPGYTWHGVRFAVEGGPWLYWQTWHETAIDVNGFQTDLSHKASMQFGWVGGARIEYGNLSLSYRYYGVKQKWNPTPGLSTGMHTLMAVYRF
jgi:hypothetical protein